MWGRPIDMTGPCSIDHWFDDVFHVGRTKPRRLLVGIVAEPRMNIDKEIICRGCYAAQICTCRIGRADWERKSFVLKVRFVISYSGNEPCSCVCDGITS